MMRVAKLTPEALAHLATANGLVPQPHADGITTVVVAGVLHWAEVPTPRGEFRWEDVA